MKKLIRSSFSAICGLGLSAVCGLANANGLSAMHGAPQFNNLDTVGPDAWTNWAANGVVLRNTRTGTSFKTWMVPIHWAKDLGTPGGGTIFAAMQRASGTTQAEVLLSDANGATVFAGPWAVAGTTLADVPVTFAATPAAKTMSLFFTVGDGNGAIAGISGFPGTSVGGSTCPSGVCFQAGANPTQGKPFPLVMDPTNGFANWSYSDNILQNNAASAQNWMIPLEWITNGSTANLTIALKGTATWAQAVASSSIGTTIASTPFVFGGATLTARSLSLPSLPAGANVYIFLNVAPGGQVGGISGLPGAAEG